MALIFAAGIWVNSKDTKWDGVKWMPLSNSLETKIVATEITEQDCMHPSQEKGWYCETSDGRDFHNFYMHERVEKQKYIRCYVVTICKVKAK